MIFNPKIEKVHFTCLRALWRHVGHPKCQMKWNVQFLKMTWNIQYTNLSNYVSNVNVDQSGNWYNHLRPLGHHPMNYIIAEFPMNCPMLSLDLTLLYLYAHTIILFTDCFRIGFANPNFNEKFFAISTILTKYHTF